MDNQFSGSVVAPATPPASAIKQKSSMIETIILIIVSIIAATFIGLFIWMFIQWNEASTNLQGQIDEAVAIAVKDKETDMENEFAEREKNPYTTFAGPADYGELTFEYPKTWSVYEAKDATSGGDYEAYLNPAVVAPVSQTSVNALRVSIVSQSFENTAKKYDSFVTSGALQQSVRQIGGESANLYVGELPNKMRGAVAIIKIRDKTAILQTDAELFLNDFYALLDTVQYNA